MNLIVAMMLTDVSCLSYNNYIIILYILYILHIIYITFINLDFEMLSICFFDLCDLISILFLSGPRIHK